MGIRNLEGRKTTMIGVVGGKPGEMNPHLLSKRPRKTNRIDLHLFRVSALVRSITRSSLSSRSYSRPLRVREQYMEHRIDR